MNTEICIDTDALRANVHALKAFIGPVRFAPVVKANAYGHGIHLVAPALIDVADAFGVYEISEAVALRSLGITQEILLLGPLEPSDFTYAIEHDVTVPLWDAGTWMRELIATARRQEKQALIQLKLDTGLTRLGIAAERASDILAKVRTEPNMLIRGAYSHLASAEELDSHFTLEQLARFEQAIPAGTVPSRHIAASAAAMLWPQTRLDLVRCGIAIYGLWPSPGTRARMQNAITLRPVLSWYTKIIHTVYAPAETPIGYGSTYRPPVDTRIGIIPIGYAEGLPRALSNNGHVLIDGIRCAIVGRVCMNMSFIDLSDTPHAHSGSLVTLIGESQGNRIEADQLATATGTINYEIAARLPTAIPRRNATQSLCIS